MTLYTSWRIAFFAPPLIHDRKMLDM